MKVSKGRPEDTIREEAFRQIWFYFEKNDDDITVPELIGKMGQFLSDTGVEPYDPCYMKRKLQEVYGERIVICNDVGKSDFITLKITANEILREFFEKAKKCGYGDPKTKCH